MNAQSLETLHIDKYFSSLLKPFLLIFLSSTPLKWQHILSALGAEWHCDFLEIQDVPFPLLRFSLFSLPLQISPNYTRLKVNVLILDGADSGCRWAQFSCHRWPFRVSRLSVVIIERDLRLMWHEQEIDRFIWERREIRAVLCLLHFLGGGGDEGSYLCLPA